MLLFIGKSCNAFIKETVYFNTSHVTVYQSGSPYLSTVPRFQYISCYCLSDSHCMSLETQWYFNTSHVTVYHAAICVSVRIWSEFQYISCYCLSVRWSHNSLLIAISIHLMLLFISPSVTSTRASTLFQYISCYCLSGQNIFLNLLLT